MRLPFSIKWIYIIESRNFDQKYKFSNKNDMVSAWRNFKNIFSRPLFTIIFRLEMLKFHPYSILTGDTMVGFVIFYVLSEWLYNMGQSRSKFSRCQFSVWSQNQCYIFRWSLWNNKFWAVTKTEALGVILSFRGWISLYRAPRQSVLFFH